MKWVNVKVDDEFMIEIKALADKRKTTVTQMTRDLLFREVDNAKKEGKKHGR